jgi:peptidoglycan/xylan/chitin deacetylase (PgdA/CDA1 family)
VFPQMISVRSTGKAVVKRALPYLCRYLGMNAALRAARSKLLLILSYHGVVRDEHYTCVHSEYTVSLKTFREQMAILSRYFRPVSVSDVADWWTGKADLPKHPVLVTFDDGYMNNLTNAAPVLLEFGVPAVIHVCTGYIDKARILWIVEIYRRILEWPKSTIPMPGAEADRKVNGPIERKLVADLVRQACKRLPNEECKRYLSRLREIDSPESDVRDQEVFGFLSWDAVRTLKKKGFDIGSHTVEHPILTRIPEQSLDQELRVSKLVIEQQTGGGCRCFAYPNGKEEDISKAVTERVERAGYEFAFTTIEQFCSRIGSRFELGRISIPGGLSVNSFHARVSGVHTLVKRHMGW